MKSRGKNKFPVGFPGIGPCLDVDYFRRESFLDPFEDVRREIENLFFFGNGDSKKPGFTGITKIMERRSK